MKHSDDNGDLTFFSDGDQILIACDKGHYWTFEAKAGEVGRAATPAARTRLTHDLERFGPAAMQALNLHS